MKINELKKYSFVIDSKEQTHLKGGTNDSNTTTSILIGDIDVI